MRISDVARRYLHIETVDHQPGSIFVFTTSGRGLAMEFERDHFAEEVGRWLEAERLERMMRS